MYTNSFLVNTPDSSFWEMCDEKQFELEVNDISANRASQNH